MADITLRDLMHWERGLRYRAPSGEAAESGLDRPISWAVTIRAASPILPALRGGEIVIAPPRLLHQIGETEMVDRAELIRILGGQPIAALMVDPSFEEGPVRGVPLLVSSGTFPHEPEQTLNRLITERRAELYRLGSDLSRALSTATMGGAGLDELLSAVEAAGHRALVLQSPEGSILARSRGAEALQPPGPDACVRLADMGSVGSVVLSGNGMRSRWLSRVVDASGQRRKGSRGNVLSIALTPDASMESERLILGQTADALELVLRDATTGAMLVRDRGNRESLVSDLLLGRLVSREAAEARARLLGLDVGSAARVAVFSTERGDVSLGSSVRSLLAEDRHRAGAAVSEREFAVILTGNGRFTTDWQELTAAQRALWRSDDSLRLCVSDIVDGASRSSVGLEQARTLVRLSRQGAIDGAVIRADDVDQIGIFALFLSPPASGIDRSGMLERLDAFATPLLGTLEEHDSARRGELVRTLDAYLRQGGALAQAADALNIHRNTLSYRLARIAELTGRDLADAQARYLLQVALSARSLQQALSER